MTMLLTGRDCEDGSLCFLRILLPIFPERLRWVLDPADVAGGHHDCVRGRAAFAQKDLKRTFATHPSTTLLLSARCLRAGELIGDDRACRRKKAAGLNGVLLQMFNHGLTAATVFCFLSFIERRTGGLRGLNEFGGLRTVAPLLLRPDGHRAVFSLGLPGLNGLRRLSFDFKGAFPLGRGTALSVFGLLVTAYSF